MQSADERVLAIQKEKEERLKVPWQRLRQIGALNLDVLLDRAPPRDEGADDEAQGEGEGERAGRRRGSLVVWKQPCCYALPAARVASRRAR